MKKKYLIKKLFCLLVAGVFCAGLVGFLGAPEGVVNTAAFDGHIVKLVSGANHTLALLSDGSVWSWGKNDSGQLGDGTFATRTLPTRVPLDQPASDIVAGASHSFAILEDGTLVGWGSNRYGQLGDGTTGNRSRPVTIAGVSHPVALAAGFAHTLAIDENGILWAWGYNIYGQLGRRGNSNLTEPKPVRFVQPTDADYDAMGVEKPDIQPTVKQVAAGYNHTLALLDDGTVWAWGYNQSGELCDGTYVNRNAPAPVTELGGTVTGLYAGSAHSLALMSDGTLMGWGSNKYGQLNPSNDVPTHNHPLLTMTGVAQPSGGAPVAAGSTHTAALLETPTAAGETVRLWGNNGWGQMGNDTSGHVNGSFLLPDLEAAALASGYNSVFVTGTDGGVWSFGYNGFGELGDGTFQQRSRPELMSMKPFYERVAPVSGLTLTPALLDWCIEAPYTGFQTRIQPDNALNSSIEWSVSDTSVADIDRDTGALTGRKAGLVTVYARAYNGLQAKSTVTIKPDPAMVNITTLPRHMVNVGNTLRVEARLTPETAYDGKVVYSLEAVVDADGGDVSADPADIGAVAAIDANSGVLTSLGNGLVRVRAASRMKPALFDELIVACGYFGRAVELLLDDGALAGELTLNVDYNTNPMTGGAVQLRAVVRPEDKTRQDVVWRSSNESIADVDETGRVTARKPGTCTISALTRDGSAQYGTCHVTVLPLAMELTLNTGDLKLPVGEKYLFKATASPARAAQAVTWTVEDVTSDSGDPVLALSSAGVATGLSPGVARVTATAMDGSAKSASCLVQVVVPVTRITLTPTVINLNADSAGHTTKQIIASFTPAHASFPQAGWTSSNINVAVVSDTGLVTAMGPGTCKITATAMDGSGRTAKATVTVGSNADTMSLNYAEYPSLALGKTLALKATVYPASSDQTVTWRLSDDSPGGVATVSDRGVVRAFDAGTVTVIAACKDDPSVFAVCVVTCVVPVTDLRVSPGSLTLAVKKTIAGGAATVTPVSAQVAVSLQPYNHTNQVVSCMSSNPLVADVARGAGGVTLTADGCATVTARAVGTAMLTFTIDGCRAALRITVKETPTGVTIADPPSALLFRGSPAALKAAVIPATSDQSLVWTSDNIGVATVDEKGVVRAVSAGTVTIRAASAGDESLFDEFTFDCQIPVTSVKLEKAPQTLTVGDTTDMSVAISPFDAYTGPAGWTVLSSKPAVAAVQKTPDGGALRLTALAAGTAVITVNAGQRMATLTVNVKSKPTGVTLTNKPSDAFLLLRGVNTLTLRAAVQPSTALQTLDWSSSDESIATVKDGVLTVRGKGTVTVTATCAQDPDLSDEVDIHCDLPVTSLRLSTSLLTLKLADGASDITVAVSPAGGYVAPGRELTGKVISGAANITLSQGSDGVFTVTPVKTGTSTISFSCNGKTATCKVTVK